MSAFINRLKLLNQIGVLARAQQKQILTRAIYTSNSLADLMKIKMPSLSPTMTEGTIVKWLKKEGDQVSPGDALFEVQTDKAVVTFDTEEEGILAKILRPGDAGVIKVGTLVGVLVGRGEDWQNVKVQDDAPAVAAPAAQAPSKQAAPVAAPSPAPAATSTHHQLSSKRLLGPVAKMLIQLYDIDITKIKGTGPHGSILKNDVNEYILANGLQPKVQHQQDQAQSQQQASVPVAKKASKSEAQPEYVDIELTNMRKVIAKRLLLSKTVIPHSYLNTTCVMDNLLKLRNDTIKRTGVKVSLNDYVIKAVALALRMVPELNSNITDLNNTTEVSFQRMPGVDISIAVATDKGLITPIVKNADRLSVDEISKTVKKLAEKAKENKLLPHEFQGGSFSISNLGMFGIKEFSAVINPPQVGILAIGNSDSVMNPDTMSKQTQTIVKLSFDERCADLEASYRFLDYFKYYIENPEILVGQRQLIDSL